jgi:hypothetical protein
VPKPRADSRGAHRCDPVNLTTITRQASDLVNQKHEVSTALVDNFLLDGTVLVPDTSNRGKGSLNYVDNARILDAEQLKCIDNFITQVHREGGSISVRQCADELLVHFPDVEVSHSAIRYAMVNFLGYAWGEVKPRKCQSDPERIDVKRTYLVDFAKALEKQRAGTHKLVFMDESYLHQNHAPKRSWIKRALEDGAFINRGSSKGKRLIIIVSKRASFFGKCPDSARVLLLTARHHGRRAAGHPRRERPADYRLQVRQGEGVRHR